MNYAAPPAPALSAVEPIAARVESLVTQILNREADRWAEVRVELGDPVDALRDAVLAGGKRLRPAFCYWGFVGTGGDPEDAGVVQAAAALELLHTFALIHDDVMDRSARRHGTDSMPAAWARRHAQSGWRGDAEHFGRSMAVLIGDLAFVYSDLMLVDAPAPARRLFAELRLELHAGQYLDLLGGALSSPDPHRARQVCRLKAGKYTVERPLHLGAALTGAQDDDPGLRAALSAYGLPLGEAFQLHDDMLGAFGDPLVTGKPVGEDLRQGKATLLVATARQRATPAQLRALDLALGRGDLDPCEVAQVQDLLELTGARLEVEHCIDRLVEQSLEALEHLPVNAEASEALGQLARFVAGRDH
jgi:geranylgeranyl diphosphate synthase type I